MDTSTVPLCRRDEDASGVTTANENVMPIKGREVTVGVEGGNCTGSSFAFCQGRKRARS